jgi:urate oxidase
VSSGHLGNRGYGKQGVRTLSFRTGPLDGEISDFTVATMLRGGIDECYLSGDNHRTVTSDAQRNVALAAMVRGGSTAEDVALAVASDLGRNYPHFPEVMVEVVRYPWESSGGGFVRAGSPPHRATVVGNKTSIQVVSGFDGLDVLLTGGSRFVGFLVDSFTSNQPAFDRPLAGSLSAEWSTHSGVKTDWRELRSSIQTGLLKSLGEVRSESVQHLLATMGSLLLEREPRLETIALRLENVTLTAHATDTASETHLYCVTPTPTAVTEVTLARKGDSQ